MKEEDVIAYTAAVIMMCAKNALHPPHAAVPCPAPDPAPSSASASASDPAPVPAPVVFRDPALDLDPAPDPDLDPAPAPAPVSAPEEFQSTDSCSTPVGCTWWHRDSRVFWDVGDLEFQTLVLAIGQDLGMVSESSRASLVLSSSPLPYTHSVTGQRRRITRNRPLY